MANTSDEQKSTLNPSKKQDEQSQKQNPAPANDQGARTGKDEKFNEKFNEKKY